MSLALKSLNLGQNTGLEGMKSDFILSENLSHMPWGQSRGVHLDQKMQRYFPSYVGGMLLRAHCVGVLERFKNCVVIVFAHLCKFTKMC